MTRLLPAAILICAGMLTSTSVTAGEVEVAVYGGIQTSPHSEISGDDSGRPFEMTAGWLGNSFDAPPYYGARLMWWISPQHGVGIEATHAKAYADDATRAEAGFERLEFTDGMNIITLNYARRFTSETRSFTPYVAVGAGVAVPHVDAQSERGRTYGYQVTGPALRVTAGIEKSLGPDWGLFAEYQGTWSRHDVDLEPEGWLETEVITSALNVGVSYRF